MEFEILKKKEESYQKKSHLVNQSPKVIKWNRAISKVRRITRGAFEGGKKIHEDYYLEHLDEKHQYAPEQKQKYLNIWKNSSKEEYFSWLKDYRENEISTENTLVAYLKNKPFLKNTMAQIRNGILEAKHSFPQTWRNKIESNPNNRLIFVVDKDYNMYVAFKEETEYGKIQHSSFLNGAPVRLAGYIEIDNEYKVKYLSSESGHYRAGLKPLIDYIKYLDNNKFVNLNEIYVQNFGDPVILAEELLRKNIQKRKDKINGNK